MRNCFYLAMLIGAILLSISVLVSSKRCTKLWRSIQIGLAVIVVVSLIGFIITLM